MSTISKDLIEILNDSLERCREHPEFFDILYSNFLNSSEEVQTIFRNVDINKIKKMVKDALYLILLSHNHSLHAVSRVNELGDYHKSIGVSVKHFDLWLESLISAVEHVDPKYDMTVDKSWRTIMSTGIDLMKKRLQLQQ